MTTLYAIHIPQGPKQTCRYDDGTGDMLPVPLGTTAFISGKTMFDILPRVLQSVAGCARVRYVPHPFEWMTPATAHSTGLTIESKGKGRKWLWISYHRGQKIISKCFPWCAFHSLHSAFV